MSTSHIPALVRRLVRTRAAESCEYCLAPERLSFHSHQVDHIVAEKHGGETMEDNLALSCICCNQAKGSDLWSIDPITVQMIALFHPRRDRWADHFELRGCLIVPLTPVGRVTVKLLQINAPDRVVERGWLVAAEALRVPG